MAEVKIASLFATGGAESYLPFRKFEHRKHAMPRRQTDTNSTIPKPAFDRETAETVVRR